MLSQLLCLSASLVALTRAEPNGGPCSTLKMANMVPKHPNQNIVRVSPNTPDKHSIVLLEFNDAAESIVRGELFYGRTYGILINKAPPGFIVRAVDNDLQDIGKFTFFDTSCTKLKQCNDGTFLTHTGRSCTGETGEDAYFEWTAPSASSSNSQGTYVNFHAVSAVGYGGEVSISTLTCQPLIVEGGTPPASSCTCADQSACVIGGPRRVTRPDVGRPSGGGGGWGGYGGSSSSSESGDSSSDFPSDGSVPNRDPSFESDSSPDASSSDETVVW